MKVEGLFETFTAFSRLSTVRLQQLCGTKNVHIW